ncbi:MAG: competence protein ComK [Cellulosilyticaceae bacterium]
MNYLTTVAIIPIYDSNGNNCTRLILDNGTEELIDMPISRFIDEMYATFHTSYSANAKWASSYLLEKNTPPLLFDAHHVFLRCQTRSHVTKGDGCYGYISLFAVDKIESTTLFLSNGAQISTCSTFKQLTKYFQQATLLYCIYSGTLGPSRILPLHTDHLLRDLSRNLRTRVSH